MKAVKNEHLTPQPLIALADYLYLVLLRKAFPKCYLDVCGMVELVPRTSLNRLSSRETALPWVTVLRLQHEGTSSMLKHPLRVPELDFRQTIGHRGSIPACRPADLGWSSRLDNSEVMVTETKN